VTLSYHNPHRWTEEVVFFRSDNSRLRVLQHPTFERIIKDEFRRRFQTQTEPVEEEQKAAPGFWGRVRGYFCAFQQ